MNVTNVLCVCTYVGAVRSMSLGSHPDIHAQIMAHQVFHSMPAQPIPPIQQPPQASCLNKSFDSATATHKPLMQKQVRIDQPQLIPQISLTIEDQDYPGGKCLGN